MLSAYRGKSDARLFSPSDETGTKALAAKRDAVMRARSNNRDWSRRRRESDANEGVNRTWKRVSYALPRAEAQQKAREFLRKYPKAAYWSEVESWRELPGDVIEFTMRRLPSAD